MRSTDFTDPFNEFVYVRSYSRWLEEQKRRETWPETIERYIDYMLPRVPASRRDEFREACAHIYPFEVMPSMRALWAAGKALDSDNMALFNCLAGDTRIVTSDGVNEIKDVVGEVVVLNSRREWVDAEVRSFGVQRTVEVKFGYNNAHCKKVRATLDHDWVLKDGCRVKTKDLVKGDLVPCLGRKRREYDSIDYALGVVHGLIYGDGTSTFAQERLMGYNIRLCGEKTELLPWLESVGGKTTYPPSFGGEPVVMLYGDFAKTHALKELPSEEETEDYLVGFFRGWMATDGSLSVGTQTRMCVGPREEEWLRRVMPRFGYYFQASQPLGRETNYGRRNKESRTLSVARYSLTKDDFLVARKRDRFQELEVEWAFRGIVEGSEREEEVYCAIVPGTHDFTLDDGLLTGNCAFRVINHPKAFAEMLYVLMNGTGFGFSVERQFINQLPRVPEKLVESNVEIVVADSKLGWAEGFYKFMLGLYQAKIHKMNYSKIRPRGTRLKTFGGRASGPGPLKQLMEFTLRIFQGAKGRQLNSLECHDICCFIANIVVVGGVRRSSSISFSNLSDQRMAHAKDGAFWEHNPQRRLANNSVAYTEKPDCASFLAEWLNLMRSGSGERGIFNRESALASMKRLGRLDRIPEELWPTVSTNPCLTGDTLVPIRGRGLCRIADLAGESHLVRDGEGDWVMSPVRKTSDEAPVMRVELSDGSLYRVTPWHVFVLENGERREAQHLALGDRLKTSDIEGCFGTHHNPDEAYLDAWLIADGTYYNVKDASKLYLYPPKFDHREALERVGASFGEPDDQGRITAVFLNKPWSRGHVPPYVLQGDRETVLAFIKGSLESDGTCSHTANGWVVQFNSTHRKFLQEVQALLRLFGVHGKIALSREAGYRMMPDGHGGLKEYWCQESWRLTVSKSLKLFADLYPERVKRGAYAKQRSVSIESIHGPDPEHREPVYCFGVPTTASFDLPTFHSGNCGEIFLTDSGLCNLSEAVVRSGDSLETLKNKVKQAAILGVIQTTFTRFNFVGRQWKINAERERLLGVSLTGLRDHDVLGHKTRQSEKWLREMRQIVWDTAREWAAALEINVPAACTCVKPSGTVSSLVGSASGIHPRYAPHYIRRVRVSSNDPLAKMMMDQGFPWCPEVSETHENLTTVVFDFPQASPETSVFKDEVTAIEQLEYWKMLKTAWCDHNPSATVYVRPNEWVEVGNWVYRNWDVIGGLTFLPTDGGVYQLAPYEQVDEDRYQELVACTPEIDFSRLSHFEQEDNTTGAKEYACSAAGGGCDIA